MVSIKHVGNTDNWDGWELSTIVKWNWRVIIVTDFHWCTIIDSELSNIMHRVQVVRNDHPISVCNGYGGKCINYEIFVSNMLVLHVLYCINVYVLWSIVRICRDKTWMSKKRLQTGMNHLHHLHLGRTLIEWIPPPLTQSVADSEEHHGRDLLTKTTAT